MDLSELISGFGVVARGPQGPLRVCDLTEDSRTVLPGSLFVARGGTKDDGRRYIEDAVRAGAVAVLSGPGGVPPGLAERVRVLESDDVEGVSARLAERFYGEPTSKLDLVGVTGTNGKTTTTALVWQVLNAAGVRCGLVGTVRIDDGREIAPAMMTTPPSIELSRTMATMVEAGCKAATIEASSHALHQKRVAALKFDVGVFTNLTGDHLDYHGTMERYADAKAMLFEMLPPDGTAVSNDADPWAARMLRDCRARVIPCVEGEGPTGGRLARGWIVRAGLSGMVVRLDGPWGVIAAEVPLIGRYNLMNVLQAASACHALGLDADQIRRGLARCKAPPGRLEPVSSAGDAASVFVDYAHTDDALRNMLAAVRGAMNGQGRLWVVFGCGGDRDRTKRPRMGLAAAELADAVVVTSDNPRSESPGSIISEILAGIPEALRGKAEVHADREEAIRHAVRRAAPGDVVVVAGKGHETEQVVSDGAGGLVSTPFDDRVVALAALDARRLGTTVVTPARGGRREPAGRHAGEG